MKRLLFSIALTCLCMGLCAQEYKWSAGRMDGSRTGCVAPSKDNVPEALGTFKGSSYIAPNGKKFDRNTTTAKVAKVVIDAQPKMARVKDVIAYSPESMSLAYPESPLSNWFIDFFMSEMEKISGKKVHVGIANFGGIRVDMPKGDVILDDLLSMFPFKNSAVYIEHKGIVIRNILEKMAATRFQVLGGVRVVAENGKLVSVEIDGQPLDDEKVYGLVTNSFLLHGGDGLNLADDAVFMEIYDKDIIDVVLGNVKSETATGRPLTGKTDGRIVIRK